MNSKLIKTLSLATLLTITGCASANEASDTSVDTTTDTTKPVITLVSDSVNVETDAKYSANDNIKSVTDDTDGILEYAKKATDDSAYYLIDDGKLDTSKAGTYKIKVTASDKSGNTATKDFDVVVKDAEKKETTKSDSAKTESSTKTESKTSKSDSKTSASTKKTSNSSSSSNTNQDSTTSATQSNTSSQSQSTPSNNTTNDSQQVQTHTHNWELKTEQVLVKDAYDEQVCTGQKYVYECGDCHQHFDTIEAYDAHCVECQPAWGYGGVYEPIYETVHHDAVYNTKYYYQCSGCGEITDIPPIN